MKRSWLDRDWRYRVRSRREIEILEWVLLGLLVRLLLAILNSRKEVIAFALVSEQQTVQDTFKDKGMEEASFFDVVKVLFDLHIPDYATFSRGLPSSSTC